MSYFQDLPQEYQDQIFEAHKKEFLAEGEDPKFADEITDDYINCHNNAKEVKEWVNEYCL